MSTYHWLLDPGHGGMKNGIYTTAPKKLWRFPDGFTIYEGLINRAIVNKLTKLLTVRRIDWTIVASQAEDTPLDDRIFVADQIYKKDKRAIFLSVHSNAGMGAGFEIFTSKGQTKSDKIAQVFCEEYKRLFPQFPFRGDTVDGDADKEEDFKVLRKTDCPALLVENLFFDNRVEADFLASEEGQHLLAACLESCIVKCENSKPI